MNFLQKLTDVIFPRVCFCCGDRISPDYKHYDNRKEYLWAISHYLCPSCLENLVVLDSDICPKCGSPLGYSGCPHCLKTDFKFIAARSVFLFDDHIKPLIHGLKYYQFLKIAPVLAAYAALYLENHWQFGKPDIIIPVPLHKVRKRERSFNQSAAIGKFLAKFCSIEYNDLLLKRTRYTQSQTYLSRKERHQNVKDAFLVTDPASLRKKKILLLDDVFTTGSTCNAIARNLKDNRITQVFVLTIARAS